MTEAYMPVARFTNALGQTELVQPDGTMPRGANKLYSAHHKGRLTCEFCEAAVHHNRGSDMICGGLPGPRPHFKTNPGQSHGDGCLLPLRAEIAHGSTEYDLTKGYRIHLNTARHSHLFNRASGLYGRGEGGKIILRNPDLEGREPFAIRDLHDLVRLMARGEPERLRDSVVIQHDKIVPWNEFLVRYSRNGHAEQRYINLMSRLAAGQSQPVVLEIETARAVPFKYRHHDPVAVQSRQIFVGRDDHGKPTFLIPRIYLDNKRSPAVMDAMAKPDRYLVLGHPRLGPAMDRGDSYLRFLNLSVQDHRQVMAVDLSELGQKSIQRMTKKIDARSLQP